MNEQPIKSAWEIALGKAEKLGKPSKEDLERGRLENLNLIGKGISVRYLSGAPSKDVEIGLKKYHGQDREIVTAAISRELVSNMFLDDPEKNERIMEILPVIIRSRENEEALNAIKNLLGQYMQAVSGEMEKSLPQTEKEIIEELIKVGIAGSALKPNLENSPRISQSCEIIKKEYSPRLEALKETLFS